MNVFEWVLTGIVAYGLFVVVFARWLRIVGVRQAGAAAAFRPVPVTAPSVRPASGSNHVAV